MKKTYNRLKREKTFGIIVGSAITIIRNGLSYYFYNKTKKSYEKYKSETDPFLIPYRWDDVELNSKRYKSWMSIGIGATFLSIYEIFYKENNGNAPFSMGEKTKILCKCGI